MLLARVVHIEKRSRGQRKREIESDIAHIRIISEAFLYF